MYEVVLNKNVKNTKIFFQVFLMTIKLYRQGIQPENIGIITPYMKQVKHLRTLFIEADIAMPKIGSVEEFQGQVCD